VREAPDHRRAWGYLGVTLEQLGLLAEAETAFIAGHYASAALRLRERHAASAACGGEGPVPDVTPANARAALPGARFKRKTLPPDPWTGATASTPALAVSRLQRFAVTLRPPDLVRDSPAINGSHGSAERAPSALESASQRTQERRESLEEIPFATTLAPPPRVPQAVSQAPKQSRPVLPLLDAALASLLVVPHEASVVVHATGLVLVALDGDPADLGGFAARLDVVHALAGDLERTPLPRRAGIAPEPFRDGVPFTRAAGRGQLVLSPPRGSRLLPLEMDADVAYLREDLVVGFDHTLLCDLGRIRRGETQAVSLVRFRGDGVIVLALRDPFLAFDVRGDEAVTLREDTLIGWLGLLAPAPVVSIERSEGVPACGSARRPTGEGPDFLTFSGEGTVLFRAPRDA